MGGSRVHSPIGTGRSRELAREIDERRAWPAALFGFAVFAAAFLIFLVQPMVGKRILPWFGGVPAVWTVCLAFHQTILFAGYAYAHILIRFFGATLQLAVHLAAVAAACFALPVLPETPPDTVAGDADPTWSVLALLARNVALPFLVLASTGPLVQVWLARAHPTVSPYSLYAVSNAGSFLALFAYPFVIEPRLSVSGSGVLWNWAFGATGLLVLVCGSAALRVRTASESAPEAASKPATPVEPVEPVAPHTTRSNASTDGTGARPVAAPAWRDALLWIALSATAVVVLMGVTNKLCLDVASIPFLWIVPLATYLLTFVIAFGSERAYRRAPYGALAVVSFLVTRTIEIDDLIVFQTAAYCALLFSSCMILHGELHRSRPPAAALTRFYLCTSAGGALGGLSVGLLAPALFDDYHELPLGLLMTLLLVLSIGLRDPGSFFYRRGPRWRWLVAGPTVMAFVAWFLWLDLRPDPRAIHKERSFFGVLSVDEIPSEDGPQRTLTNGSTVHGAQLLAPERRHLPTSYYGRAAGLGLALTSRARDEGTKIGIVGLGVGTIAAYGREGDRLRFYEVDPVVARLAGPSGAFTYLSDSKSAVEVVVGDGRRAIEDEQRMGREQGFDVLVLDAFTSDAIPVHLMTREAFECYFQALAPDGLLAVHVTNRHFHLMDLVSRLGRDLGGHSLQIRTAPIPRLQTGAADWVILAREEDRLASLRIRIEKRLRVLRLFPGSILIRRGSDLALDRIPVWTDDYSDLSSVVRWR